MEATYIFSSSLRSKRFRGVWSKEGMGFSVFFLCKKWGALTHERSSGWFSNSRGLSASVSFLSLLLPLFPLFGSRTIFCAGKTPKIPFL